jgi:hypothetical protein
MEWTLLEWTLRAALPLPIGSGGERSRAGVMRSLPRALKAGEAGSCSGVSVGLDELAGELAECEAAIRCSDRSGQ